MMVAQDGGRHGGSSPSPVIFASLDYSLINVNRVYFYFYVKLSFCV